MTVIVELGYPHKVDTSYQTFGKMEPNIIINLSGLSQTQSEGAAAILGHN